MWRQTSMTESRTAMLSRLCECGVSLEEQHPNRVRCAPCAQQALKTGAQRNKGITVAPDAVTCPVCQERMNCITAGHFRKHGYVDAATFKRVFNLVTLKAPSLCQRPSAAMTTEKVNKTKGRQRTNHERERISTARKDKGVGV